MILILSTYGDSTTDEVIVYLQDKGAAYFRLNDNDIFRYKLSISISEHTNRPYFLIDTGETVIHSDMVKTVWYRKFGFYSSSIMNDQFEKQYGTEFLPQFTSEYKGTLNLICKCLAEKKWLANYKTVKPDKFMVLNIAHSLGIRVPMSLITNNKSALLADMPKNIIAKSLTDSSFIEMKNKCVAAMYTFELRPFQKYIPESFLPTLVQETIEKEFEIRTFYIDGHFFSMAIFSQNDPKTRTDFRKYNDEHPNRYVPYVLDKAIEMKLTLLLEYLDINTGSLDLIFTPNAETVLLEINPCGQFGMMSKPCNYPLEEIVADTLIKFEANQTA